MTHILKFLSSIPIVFVTFTLSLVVYPNLYTSFDYLDPTLLEGIGKLNLTILILAFMTMLSIVEFFRFDENLEDFVSP